MTRFTAIAAALLLTAGAASAQVTSATSVGGETGVAGYPVQVVGANGIVYACQPADAGVYKCVTGNATAANSTTGFGEIGVSGVGGLVAAVVVIGVVANNSEDTVGTNGTNGTN